MKKDINLEENAYQVDKIMRQVRREKKLDKKMKRIKQVRRQIKLEMLTGWIMVLCCASLLSACATVKKEDVRMERDSLVSISQESTLAERREERAQSLFELLKWEDDRQAALIRTDSGLVFQPDGSFQMQRGTVWLHSTRRQETASRSEQELADSHRLNEHSSHDEEASLSEDHREQKKKKPPGRVLLIPALIGVFAFLAVIRKARR